VIAEFLERTLEFYKKSFYPYKIFDFELILCKNTVKKDYKQKAVSIEV
jgi:hypothetical protein